MSASIQVLQASSRTSAGGQEAPSPRQKLRAGRAPCPPCPERRTRQRHSRRVREASPEPPCRRPPARELRCACDSFPIDYSDPPLTYVDLRLARTILFRRHRRKNRVVMPAKAGIHARFLYLLQIVGRRLLAAC